jgi:hypothetical protein
LLLLIGFGRVLTHLNDLRGRHQLEVGRQATVPRQQRANGLFLANEHNLGFASQLLGGQHGTIDSCLGRKIAPHSVQGYLHVWGVKEESGREARGKSPSPLPGCHF